MIADICNDFQLKLLNNIINLTQTSAIYYSIKLQI